MHEFLESVAVKLWVITFAGINWGKLSQFWAKLLLYNNNLSLELFTDGNTFWGL